ncbi:MAG: UDP-N-acetylglucosamine--LPS N-acetylglucosamine transferase [Acidimicrobiales bacterium]
MQNEERADRTRRVLFVCSSGGHLAQLLELDHWWKDHECRWVTFDLPDARSRLGKGGFIPAHYPTTRNVINAAKNLRLARRVIDEFDPHVVISNGAAIAVPFFIAARRRFVPTVFVEVYDRVDSRTLTGRLVRPWTTSFLVQWPEQQELNPGSTLIGTLY